MSNPQREDVEPARSDDIIRFDQGHRLIFGLNGEHEGEWELVTPDGYFLITDGRLDPQLAEARVRCAIGEPKEICREVEGLSLDQLHDRIRNLAG